MTSTTTMSEARRYQQLRAHLGYLKLNDAAEALQTAPAISGRSCSDQNTDSCRVSHVLARGGHRAEPSTRDV